jgi:hypothetical protein
MEWPNGMLTGFDYRIRMDHQPQTSLQSVSLVLEPHVCLVQGVIL